MNKEFKTTKTNLYIQKGKFVHTFRKCEIGVGAPKIDRKPLFMRISSFRGVFSYPVAKILTIFE